MDLKLCPRCNKLPDVKVNKRWFGYECIIHCDTLGCELYWPFVSSGMNKDKVMNKAAAQWNNAVSEY